MLKHIGTASLRILTAKRLREMEEPATVTFHGKPVAAIVPYELYQRMQQAAAYWYQHATKPAK